MSFISLMGPAFISLVIYLNFKNHRKNLLKDMSYYAICNIIINACVLLVVSYVFGHENITWTVQFTLKYLFMASVIATILPFIIRGVFKFVGKWLPPTQEIIETGINKNGRFSVILFCKKNKTLANNIIFILSGLAFFYILEIAARFTAVRISNFGYNVFVSPFLFTMGYFLIFLLIQIYLPRVLAKIFSIVSYMFYIVLFIANYMLLHIKSEALSVGELTNTGEGAKYLNFIVKELNFVFILVIVLAIVSIVINYRYLKRIKVKKQIKPTLIVMGAIVVCYLLGVLLLPTTNNDWETITTPRYYYNNFINSKKSLAVLGLYEYTYRDAYLSLKSRNNTYGNTSEIEAAIAKYHLEREDNQYTGIFKDKNLIMVMLESIDYVVTDKDVMPAFSNVMKNSWNFPNRYSALSSGGSTILTEYVSQTGLLYDQVYYNDIFKNEYDYSLVNLFKQAGYSTNSMHSNFGSYYNRQQLHSVLGYEHSYFLQDMSNQYELYNDPQLVDNDDLYNKIIPHDQDKFMSYIVTITPHGPYDDTNEFCTKANHDSSQTDCFNYLAGDTDKFVDHLLKRLENDDLLKDTVIVFYTDHPAYAYDYPKDYLNSLKTIDEQKHIKAVPFVIYSQDLGYKSFDNLLFSDIDIVPTLLNMFGIDYNPDDYLGVDLFSKDHMNLSIFTDHTWYDGNVYSGDLEVDTSTESYRNNTQYVNDKLELNSMILSNHYYNKNARKK